jgi:uncharacterized protein YcbK (DUF882 family)
MQHRRLASLGAPLLATFLAQTPTASADVTHVIARGHTLKAIAARYHVSQKAIMEANHITDTRHLKIGDTLIIPGVGGKDSKGKETKRGARGDEKGSGRENVGAARPKHPNVVHAIRLGEEFTIRVKDGRGHVPPAALKAFEKMMRSSGNATHPVEPRLVALIGVVSNHFGGKTLEIVSGYRPYTPTQYTPHSNHNLGHALDFRIQGVPNEALRDFCKTLRNVGCGYYPNSTFVHLDVRDKSVTWVDYSHPGEPPRYDKPNAEADEGTSDVPEETHVSDPSHTPEAESNAAPGGSTGAASEPTPTKSP